MSLTLSGSSTGKINNLTVPTASGTVVGSSSNYPLNIDASASNESLKIDSNGRLEIPNQPYAYGDVAVGSSASVRDLTVTASEGFTFDASTDRLTALIAGTYMIHIHQLVDTNANGWYLHARVNGGLIKYGYVTGSQATKDCEISLVYNLAVNDYIDFYVSATATNTWSGPHSNFFVFKIN